MIENDYICRGEGVYFLRKLFDENVDRPIKHPLGYSSFNSQVMGVPWATDSGILITGVGCPNKCRFCATSHFFGDYTAYLKTGKDIFDLCCQYEDEMNITDFGILDENFLKMKDRAIELLELMEKNNRRFTFVIFSSAETIGELDDLDILVGMGVNFIWIGVESQHGQGEIWFNHEHFTRDESREFLRLAFEIDYSRNGASMLRAMKTALMGYIYCNEHDDENVRKSKASFKKRLKMMRYFLTAAAIFVQNRKSEYLLREIKELFQTHFGRPVVSVLAASALVVLLSLKEYLRCRISGDTRNPKTSCLVYNENKISHDPVKKKTEVIGVPSKILHGVSGQAGQ